ncbi:MAG TPA: hypothetical protein VFY86_01895 [Nocardioides sp.]|nr:hypothetical protein [Nocardioides sp.]
MRRAALLTVLTVLTLLALAGLAGPAGAGGPTSVVVTVPGEGRSTALYYTDTAYDRLGEAVGVGGDVEVVSDPGGLATETPVTLTWLIHDVTPWRVDRVYVLADTATWVSTQESLGGGPLAEVEPVWHRAGPELASILDQVLPEANGYERDTVLDLTPEPAQAAAQEPGGTPSLLLVGIGVAGLLAGLLAGVLGTVTALAVRHRHADAETATPAGTEVPTGEQLAWP